MTRDEDLLAYSARYTTEAEYNESRVMDIAENVKDELDNLTSDIQLALEYKRCKNLKTVLETVNKCIEMLDDVMSGKFE